MAAQPQEKVTPISQPRQNLEVIVTGKIEHVELVGKEKDIYRNVIITPAVDEYSFPFRFCIMSRTRLGDKNNTVTVHANVICRPWKDNSGSYRYPHELWAV